MDVIRHVVIRGRVQGVGFRAWTEYTTLERGLQGWVRNRRDGAVEALFAGPPDVVAAARAWNLPGDYIGSLQHWLPRGPVGAGSRKLGDIAWT